MTEEKRYDVFLSHSSADKAVVEIIARRLVEAGLTPWLVTGRVDKTTCLWNLRRVYCQTCEQWPLEEE